MIPKKIHDKNVFIEVKNPLAIFVIPYDDATLSLLPKNPSVGFVFADIFNNISISSLIKNILELRLFSVIPNWAAASSPSPIGLLAAKNIVENVIMQNSKTPSCNHPEPKSRIFSSTIIGPPV